MDGPDFYLKKHITKCHDYCYENSALMGHMAMICQYGCFKNM